MKLLQKWQCHRCEKGWLVILEDAQDRDVGCPYCLKRDHAEAVAEQRPEDDYEEEMGCLWPGYNEFDKLAQPDADRSGVSRGGYGVFQRAVTRREAKASMAKGW
jgi:hypothetical protein